MIRLIIILCIFSSSALADIRFSVGLSNIYTNINDNQFNYEDEYEQIGNDFSGNIGINYNTKYNSSSKLLVSLTTNRLFSKFSNRIILDEKENQFKLKSRSIVDSLSIGKTEGRFNHSLFIARVDVEKQLFYNEHKLGTKFRDIVLLYGFSGGYFITKDINVGIILIAPNETLDLEFGGGLFINYYL